LGRPWPVLIVAGCVAVALVNWLGAPQPVRTIFVFWFFLTCPGMAVVGLIGIRDRVAEVVLAIALSLALDTGVALVMGLAEVWSPDAGLAVLIGISLVGAVLQTELLRRTRLAELVGAGIRGQP
jgi:hypothetical protein